MPVSVKEGDAFLVPSGPEGNHLFVVATRENKDGFRLLVPVSTVREGRHHDPACVLKAGDHPFIRHDSYAVYSKADQKRSDHIQNCVDKGIFISQPPVSDDVLDRVCDGFEKSDFTRNWVFDFLRSLE